MLEEFAAKHQLPAYRLGQFNLAYYQHLISSFAELSTWPKALRVTLEKEEAFSSLAPISELTSQKGNTVKTLFKRVADGQPVETVLMRYQDGRNSICVSCMVGCPVGCTFCATGKLGFKANLTGREIVDQILHFARILNQTGEKITNVVFMGMGEPLLNLPNVWAAIETLTNPEKFGLSQRRITVSTSGYSDQLKELLKLGFQGRIAISLHAPNQTLREKLMPHAAKAYHLDKLLDTLDVYTKKSKRRVTYEYIMIQGVNDNIREAHQLVSLFKHRLAHINLIPCNPIEGNPYQRSPKDRIHEFAHILAKYDIPHTVRVTMGDDINAACGQLAGKGGTS